MARRKTKPRRKESAPGWAWMLFGLSIGLCVALFVWLKGPEPFAVDTPRRATIAAPVAPAPTSTAATLAEQV